MTEDEKSLVDLCWEGVDIDGLRQEHPTDSEIYIGVAKDEEDREWGRFIVYVKETKEKGFFKRKDRNVEVAIVGAGADAEYDPNQEPIYYVCSAPEDTESLAQVLAIIKGGSKQYRFIEISYAHDEALEFGQERLDDENTVSKNVPVNKVYQGMLESMLRDSQVEVRNIYRR